MNKIHDIMTIAVQCVSVCMYQSVERIIYCLSRGILASVAGSHRYTIQYICHINLSRLITGALSCPLLMVKVPKNDYYYVILFVWLFTKTQKPVACKSNLHMCEGGKMMGDLKRYREEEGLQYLNRKGHLCSNV